MGMSHIDIVIINFMLYRLARVEFGLSGCNTHNYIWKENIKKLKMKNWEHYLTKISVK